MTPSAVLSIATRNSPLALWQADHVCQQLRQKGIASRLLPMTTAGDQLLGQSLSAVGGKGLFIKALEVALQKGHADLAVHSLKDVPTPLPDGFTLACVLPRSDPRDAWVSSHYPILAALPIGGKVGTSSLRRSVFLQHLRPDLEVLPLRGNLQTRLRKLDEGQLDGLVLAAAGLQRLGLQERIADYFPTEDMLPSPGQGVLGVEILRQREEALLPLLGFLNDGPTQLATTAERALADTMEGGCSMPLAAFAAWQGKALHLQAAWGQSNPQPGQRPLLLRCHSSVFNPDVQQAEALGTTLGHELKALQRAQAV